MQEKSPSATREEERLELERLLASPLFAHAPSLSRILAYVCEQYFAGHAGNIKEYNIAVDALGRPPDFSPNQDSIVRVEFGRLRARLHEYYKVSGTPHGLWIKLPDTGYIPKFVLKPRQSDTRADNGRPEFKVLESETSHNLKVRQIQQNETPPRHRGKVFLALGLVSLVFLALLYRLSSGSVALVRPFHNLFLKAPRSSGAAAAASGPVASADAEVRICAGDTKLRHLDAMGRAWLGDRYFTGGVAISKPGRRILRTLDPFLYRNAREGDFRYDIPLRSGVYELHLHFAEIVYGNSEADSTGEGDRRFTVTLNGTRLLSNFDIVLNAAGPDTADQVVFKDVSPGSDGFLHLTFASSMGAALLNGIEILPSVRGQMRPVRIVCANRMYHDGNERLWESDRYFLGGRLSIGTSNIAGTADPEMYSSERWGSFTYAVPVAQGQYGVTLRFAESNFGIFNFGDSKYDIGGIGSRIFDVYCNDIVLIKNLDIFKEAHGPNKALEKSFHGLTPNGQGKLFLSFVPVKDYPTVRAIEVIDESQ